MVDSAVSKNAESWAQRNPEEAVRKPFMHPDVQGQPLSPQLLRLLLFVTRFVPMSPTGAMQGGTQLIPSRLALQPVLSKGAPAAQRADMSTANSTTSQPRCISAFIRNSRQYILLKHYMSMCFIAILYCILI